MKKTLILSILVLFTVNIFAASEKLFMLRDNGPLRIENGSNGVEWAETVPCGTELELESSEIVYKDLITSKKTYNDVKFYKVKYNKKTYYVQESDAEPCNSNAVIQKNAVLFTRPTLYSFRNAMLDTGTIVAEGITLYEYDYTFTKITFYDTNDKVKRSRYVLSNTISNSEKDVKAIMLLEKAKTTDNEDLKREFLNNLKSIKTSTLISDYIALERAKLLKNSSFSEENYIQLDEYTTRIYTNDGSKVNVRSAPGKDGQVVGQFESVQAPLVLVSKKTEETQEIDGITESWYFVTEVENTDSHEIKPDGIEGWIFGGYLKNIY